MALSQCYFRVPFLELRYIYTLYTLRCRSPEEDDQRRSGVHHIKPLCKPKEWKAVPRRGKTKWLGQLENPFTAANKWVETPLLPDVVGQGPVKHVQHRVHPPPPGHVTLARHSDAQNFPTWKLQTTQEKGEDVLPLPNGIMELNSMHSSPCFMGCGHARPTWSGLMTRVRSSRTVEAT